MNKFANFIISWMQINHQLSTWLQLFERCHTSPPHFVKPRLTNARFTLNTSTLCRPRFPLLPSAVLVKDWMFFGKGFYLPSTVAWFLSPWLTTNWQITLSAMSKVSALCKWTLDLPSICFLSHLYPSILSYSTVTWTRKRETWSWGSSALAPVESWLPLTCWYVQ